jgi:hypothetical protein
VTIDTVWRPSFLWAIGIVAVVGAAALAGEPWERLGPDGARAVIAQVVLVSALMGLLWGIVPASLLLARVGAPRRVLVAVACVSALLTGGATVVVRDTMGDVHEYAEAARWRARYDPDASRPLGEVVSAVVRSSMAASARRTGVDGWRPVYRWWSVQAGVTAFAMALIGVALAQSRRVMLAFRLAAIPVVWTVLVSVMLDTRRGSDWSPVAEGWGSVAVMFTIAFLQLAATRVLAHPAEPSGGRPV